MHGLKFKFIQKKSLLKTYQMLLGIRNVEFKRIKCIDTMEV